MAKFCILKSFIKQNNDWNKARRYIHDLLLCQSVLV
jgi:hypothetical protein